MLDIYQKENNKLVKLNTNNYDINTDLINRKSCGFISEPDYTITNQDDKILLTILEPKIKTRVPIKKYHIYINNENDKHIVIHYDNSMQKLPMKDYTLTIIAEDRLGNLSEKKVINILKSEFDNG